MNMYGSQAGSNTETLTLCFPAVKYERIKFLVIALKNSVEIYAWAPKPYHKFMAFKVTGARQRMDSGYSPEG